MCWKVSAAVTSLALIFWLLLLSWLAVGLQLRVLLSGVCWPLSRGYCSVTKLYLTLCDLMAVACQIPLSTGFFRQEYWCGLPFPSPGDLPGLGIQPVSPALAGKFFTTESPGRRPLWCRHQSTSSRRAIHSQSLPFIFQSVLAPCPLTCIFPSHLPVLSLSCPSTRSKVNSYSRLLNQLPSATVRSL